MKTMDREPRKTAEKSGGAEQIVLKRRLAAQIPLAVFACAGLIGLLAAVLPRAVERGGSYMLYSLLLIAAWLVLTVKWKVQLALTVRRFRSGGGLEKTPFERVFGIGMTVLAVLLAAASFLVYMKTGTAS